MEGHLGGSVSEVLVDFSSSHDLMICEIEPCIGLCTDSIEPAWDSLCPSPACPCSLSLSLSLSLSQTNIKKKKYMEGCLGGSVG